MSVKPQELAHNCGRLRTFLTEWIVCLLESAFSEWNWRDGWRPQNVPCKVFHSSCANRATHIKDGCQQTPISSLWQKGNESLTTLQAAGRLWNIYESWSQFSQWQSLGNTFLFSFFVKSLWYYWRYFFNNRHVTWNWKFYSENNPLSFQTWLLQASPFYWPWRWPCKQPLTSFRK